MLSSLLLLSLQSVYAELRDPTQPAKYTANQAAAVDTSHMELSLTLVSLQRKVVVINGLSLTMGDKIGSNTIIAIEPNNVRLSGPSGIITLFLLDNSVKQAAKNNM